MAGKRGRPAGKRAVRGLKNVSSDALTRELARRQGMASTLMRQRQKLAAQLDALDRKIARFGGSAPSGRRGRGPGQPRGQNSSTLAGALAALLKGKTMSVTDMAQAVQDAGYKTNSPNFRTIVNAAMIAHKDLFRRVSRGQYTAK